MPHGLSLSFRCGYAVRRIRVTTARHSSGDIEAYCLQVCSFSSSIDEKMCIFFESEYEADGSLAMFEDRFAIIFVYMPSNVVLLGSASKATLNKCNQPPSFFIGILSDRLNDTGLNFPPTFLVYCLSHYYC